MVWYSMVWFLIILGTCLATFVFMSMLKAHILVRFGMVRHGLVWYGMVFLIFISITAFIQGTQIRCTWAKLAIN